jgi:hypothetical protein
MMEEEDALLHAVDDIWSDIKKLKETEFASREIQSSWKNRIE